MAKLLTHHDPSHIHAICGFLALMHYLYRFRQLSLDVPSSGFGNNLHQDIFAMAIMALPNLTSFLFRTVAAKRCVDGLTIWQEYRWHSFIFAVKYWIILALMLYKTHLISSPERPKIVKYEFIYRIVIEFGNMYAAQYATNLYPPQGSSVRGFYAQSPFMIFFAGYIQFMGRAFVLYGTPDPRDSFPYCWLGICIIQLNAFNMTLRKKRIIGPNVTKGFYGIMLAYVVYVFFLRRIIEKPPVGIFDGRFQPIYLGSIAYCCRRYGLDRYSSWIVSLSIMSLMSHRFGLFSVALG